MATSVYNDISLMEACRRLFGGDIQVDAKFLAYMQESGIKKAYRQRVKEQHPDTGASSTEGFHLLQESYNLLIAYITRRPSNTELAGQQSTQPSASKGASPRTATPRSASPQGASQQSASPVQQFYKGELPPTQLRFGQYLYYRGLISWKTLIDAVCWQKNENPDFGAVARSLNLLSPEALKRISQGVRKRERFGEAARRLGYLGREDVDRILMRQHRSSKHIGQYFVTQGILSHSVIERCLGEHRQHNMRRSQGKTA